MQVVPGTRLGQYEIVAPIGAGGMGEVWRARDTRIGRDVAIKILPATFTSDPERLRRFQQEAQSAGTLNHPNLVTVHDVGADNGTSYVVMELLEGETLREKIEHDRASVRLSVRKAIDYSVQIASGLAAAHEKGIVHRDLKPENIFITKDGRAKILDFGLAKVTSRASVSGTAETVTQQRATAAGTVLGTAGYMSPEQVRGTGVDHRSDIFSFGTVLYEMLAGRPAFVRGSSAETMTAILKEDPPELADSGATVPPAVDVVVRHCLEKNPEERFQSARDLAFDLQRVSSASGPAAAIPKRRVPLPWILTAVFAAIAVAAGVAAWRNAHRPAAPTAQPAARTFALLTSQPGVDEFPSLSPDGKTFVFQNGASGKADIYLQRVDGRKAINLTKDSPFGNSQPALSPDGSQIAFRSERDGGGIFVMGATGESVRRLTAFGFNPSWSPDGSELVISTELVEMQPQTRPGFGHLVVVNVQTGATRDLTRSDGVQPSWSPHGDRIAYWGLRGQGGQRDIFTVDPHAANPENTITSITNDESLDWNPVWSPDGRFLYFGSNRDWTMNLWRVAIDEHTGVATGPLEPMSLPTQFAGHFTIARGTGALAYTAPDIIETLWRVPFDPHTLRVTGPATPILGGAMVVLQNVDVSPDGKHLAFSNVGTREDVYVVDSDGSNLRQLTNDPQRDRGPTWSPDGNLLYFYSQRSKRYEVWSIRADGSGLRQVSHTTGTSWWFPRPMPDGRSIYVDNQNGIAIMKLNADGTAGEPQLLPPIRGAERVLYWPRVSPDGSRFVGTTNSTPIDAQGGGSIWMYSVASKSYEKLAEPGTFPEFLPDGKHVLFVDRGELRVVDVDTKAMRPVATPHTMRQFAVAPDGRTLYLHERTTDAHIWMMSAPH